MSLAVWFPAAPAGAAEAADVEETVVVSRHKSMPRATASRDTRAAMVLVGGLVEGMRWACRSRRGGWDWRGGGAHNKGVRTAPHPWGLDFL